MEQKDIIEKALKGEDYAADIKDFDSEKIKELDVQIAKAWQAEAEKAKAETVAFRKEKQRLENPPKKEEDAVQTQLRAENMQLAREEFFSDSKFKLTDQEKAQFDEEFKRLDSGKISPKLIMADLKKAFVAVRGDALLESHERIASFEKDARFHMADQAGGNGGPGSPDDAKYSQAAKDLFKSWQKQGFKGKTLEDAQRLANRGQDWNNRSLSS